MTIHNIEQLDDMQVDLLKEIGNIGVGNAVTSLSQLVGEEVHVKVPQVKILSFSDAADMIGGPENVVAGLLIKLDSGINGMILYIFEKTFISSIYHNFFQKEISDLMTIDEMGKSMLCEIGNIMAGSYVNAISQLTEMFINISTPTVCIDMAGAILSVPSIEFAKIGDKVLFIDDSFSIGEDEVRTTMLLVPEMESLNLLFDKLGVG